MKNIHIDGRNKTAEFDLNLFFYPEEIVEETMNHFRGLCKFEIEKTRERINIKMKMKTKGLKTKYVAYEFVNHLLAEVKNEQVGV